MFKSLNTFIRDQIKKGGPGSGCKGDGCGRPSGAKTELGTDTEGKKAHPAKRKLSVNEAFKYYVKVKDANFGKNVVAQALNRKVGMAEGMSKAYREKAGKMGNGPKKEKLLSQAYKLKLQAEEYASARDSNLGKPAHKTKKFAKQDELTEDQVLDLLNSGEFDELMMDEILQDLERG